MDIFRIAYDVRMEAESDTAEIRLYGEIVQDGPDWWKWSKEDKSAAEFDKAVKEVIDKGAKKLVLRINSPGGVCTESIAMRTILGNAGFEEIDIRIEGMCASAATNIATIPGAHVAIAEGSEYMIHNPWCVARGNANDIESTVARLRNIEQMTRGFYTKRTGQTEEKIKAWMDAETWFSAEQTVEYGFADEVLKAEVAESESPAVSCVSRRAMDAMRSLYKTVPEQITLRDPEPVETKQKDKTNKISDGTPIAGGPTEIHHKEENHMEINEITMDQLREGNPALFAQVQQNAVEAERERIEEIDALTVPGCEEMAEQAKADGMTAMEFQKSMVKAIKQKKENFMKARQGETKPAQGVTGGTPNDGREAEEQEILANAKDIAAYAQQYSGSGSGMY